MSEGTAVRPTPGRAAHFALPPLRSLALANGFRTTLVEAGTVPSVSFRLVLRVGAIDAGGDTWLDQLLADYLSEGAGDRDTDTLARTVAGLGGRLSITAGADTTTVSLTVLAEYAGAAVEVLADVAARPRFPESEFARLQADLERRLHISRAEPSALAADAFQRGLYGDHPYGPELPAAETIAAFDLEAVRRLYRGNVGPRRAHLIAAGRLQPDALAAAVEGAFGSWSADAPDGAPSVEPTTQRIIHAIDRPGAEQSTIMIGLPVMAPGHNDYVPMVVTNALLGGAFNSRVTRNIREEKGYTYSPRSSIVAHRYASHWVQVADVTTAVTGPSLEEILREIDRLRADRPPTEELQGIQAYVAGSQTMRYATPAGILAQLAFLDLHRLDTSYAEQFVGRVYQIGPAEVQRIAEHYLDPQRMTIAVAGDLDRVRDQLAPFGAIEERLAT